MAQADLAKLLEANSELMSHHGKLLWEEEKHYTWWTYILFGALTLVLSFQYLTPCQKILLIIPASGFGIFISCVGIRVIRREGDQLHEALQIHYRLLEKLGLSKYEVMSKNGKTEKLLPSHDIVRFSEVTANRPFKTLMRHPFAKDRTIRDFFQITLIVAAFGYALFDFLSIIILFGLLR
jgi:hypothetical protein